MSVEWKESLSTGVVEIDGQHKELINMVNKLMEACSQGKGRAELGNVVDFLGNYVIAHFNDEEALQVKFKYPQYNEHKEQHKEFIRSFAELKNKFDSQGATINSVTQINRVVVDWLIKHICNEDKKLGEYLKTKI